MPRPMTADEAADYAPQWGSYMTAGDPGAIMYSRLTDRPDLVLAHVESVLMPECRERLAAGDTDLEGDPERLEALAAYLRTLIS